MADPITSSLEVIAGVAVGTAAAAALEPAVELPRQKAWSQNKVRVLDPAVMARLVASGGIDLGSAQADGGVEGYDEDKINALVYLAQTVPGFAEAVTMLRRKTISPADFDHTLIKSAMDARYYTAVEDLQNVWLSPQQVALGIVRSLIKDPGLMPVDLDTSGGVVPAYQQAALDALTEAAGGGTDEERLRVMVGSIGLPMSTQQAASAFFRGIIAQGDFNRSILEGDVRPEWAPFILEQARAILSPDEWAELNLRGFATKAQFYAGTALHGMSQADSDNLFDVKGRPLAVHQITTGLARGGVYDGPTAAIPAEYMAAIRESNIRPEYYNLAYANRYTLPSAFVLKSLATSNDLTQAQSEQLLLEIGWPPDLALSVSTVWAGGSATTAAQKKQTLSHLTAEYLSGALTRAALTTALMALGYTAQQASDEIDLAEFTATKAVRTKATTAIGKRYIALQLTQAQAEADMLALGWPQGAVDKYVAGWNAERDDEGTTLTKAQVVKAAKLGTLSQADALARLEVLGVAAADAQILLTDA